MKRLLYIANWKMTVTPEKACAFYFDNKNELLELTKKADIILCPSFVILGMLSQHISELSSDCHLFFGAQNCSEYEKGAYTGEVDALTLKQVGCTFCIVGHSERRTLFGETNEVIAGKIQQLLTHNITPILCIGETRQEREEGNTIAVLEKQLHYLDDLYKHRSTSLVIAYEPVWAIGTGIVPSLEELSATIAWIKAYTKKKLPNIDIVCVYGGSVNQESIKELKTLSQLDGFLIGGASSDFQTFKNIVV